MKTTSPLAGIRKEHLPFLAIAMVATLIELVLWLSDLGLIGTARWRLLALQNGAFWAGLLYNWQPNYSGQSLSMFATYSMLHAGPFHLLGNLAALAWLAPRVIGRIGAWRAMGLWGVSVLGGAILFGLLTVSPSPMVGMSGALFGLMGGLSILRYRKDGDIGRLAGTTGLLVLLNLATLFLQGGALAWQTHLGGFLAGALYCAVQKQR